MILPESTYREKQCRVMPTTNERGKTVPTACAGSMCAHWRWSAEKETTAFLELVREHMANSKDDFGKAVNAVYAKHKGQYVRTEGYCGLAGVPK